MVWLYGTLAESSCMLMSSMALVEHKSCIGFVADAVRKGCSFGQ